MKKISLSLILLLVSVFSSSLFAQSSKYNLDDGFVADGYDVVSYFQDNEREGVDGYELKYDGVRFKFSSKKNLELFKSNPIKYIPQYGGWCAYAVAVKSEKMGSNPKSYEIRDGKLYLFYKRFFTDTLEDWLDEDPNNLVKQADKNWEKIKSFD